MAEEKDKEGRVFIGIMFDCCHQYSRVYKNKAGTAYVGWCPNCLRKLEINISEDGADDRFFRAL